MARIRFGSNIIEADIIKQVEGSVDWLVQAGEHGARFVKGSILRVQPKEFVDGPPQVASAAAPQPVQSNSQTIAAAAESQANPAQSSTQSAPATAAAAAVSADVSAEIVPPAPPATLTQDTPMSSLADKLALAASAAQDITDNLGKQADQIIARKATIEARGTQLFSMHQQVLDQADRGLDAIESAVRQLSNSVVAGTTGPAPAAKAS